MNSFQLFTISLAVVEIVAPFAAAGSSAVASAVAIDFTIISAVTPAGNSALTSPATLVDYSVASVVSSAVISAAT